VFGCLGRLGCLILLAVLAVGGWFTKDLWYPKVRGLIVSSPPAATVVWQAITPDAARAGEQVAARLDEKSGPVFASLTPAEFAAWQLAPAMKIFGSSAANPEASVHGDTLYVRANVAVSELGDPKQLGPLARMLDGKQPVRIGGQLSMVQPGLIGLRVSHLSVNELKLPNALIAKIVKRIAIRERTDSLAPGLIAFPVPTRVADVRVTNGKIMLYKAVP